ncbi:MAG: glutamate-cysteine ligase family protein [Planctomycetota bacterium]
MMSIHENFKARTRPTVGVEAEFLMQYRDTTSPACVIHDLMKRLPKSIAKHVHTETYQFMVELVTPKCTDADQAIQRLCDIYDGVSNTADKMGVDLLWRASPPDHWRIDKSMLCQSERLTQVKRIVGDRVDHLSFCGLHVHVAVARKTAIEVHDRLQAEAPKLASLTANSPGTLRCGTPTTSVRTMTWANDLSFPGFPHRFETWAGFYRYIGRMRKLGRMMKPKDIWHLIRPSTKGTIETRVCDLPSRMSLIASAVEIIQHAVIDATQTPGRDNAQSIESIGQDLTKALAA